MRLMSRDITYRGRVVTRHLRRVESVVDVQRRGLHIGS